MKYVGTREISSKNEYEKLFASRGNIQASTDTQSIVIQKKKEKALEMALETRKFEIELYWKRATYFWAFIALMFTSFFIVLNAEHIKPEALKNELALFICAIGLFLSICWYFVNKGAKYWQENWELHVDLLEDDVMGPLYKTTKKSQEKGLVAASKYSVGKTNILISLMMIVVWFMLLFNRICAIGKLNEIFQYVNEIAIGVFLLFFLIVFFVCCRSSQSNGTVCFSLETREIED